MEAIQNRRHTIDEYLELEQSTGEKLELFGGIIKRLQAANFMLHFVKKPRRC
jgi:hypothetical protein